MCFYSSFDARKNFLYSWTSSNNVLGSDFNLYSSFTEAIFEVNEWQFCNYDDNRVGFPRDCAPISHEGGQWNAWGWPYGTHNKEVYFEIYFTFDGNVLAYTGMFFHKIYTATGDVFNFCFWIVNIFCFFFWMKNNLDKSNLAIQNGLNAWYIGDSFDEELQTWYDISGNGYHSFNFKGTSNLDQYRKIFSFTMAMF